MAKKLTPRIVTAEQATEILSPSDAPAPRLSRPLAPGKLRTRASFADAIGRLWAQAEENFIAIGRYLNHAKTTLEHGEFMEMVERDLPFRYSTGNRMMKVAAALDANVLSLDTMPGSYATAYEVLTLTDEERSAAAEQGLIRPDVQRKEIAEFKKRLRAPSPAPSTDRRTELLREIKQAKDEVKRWKERQAQLEAELAALS
ncbi:hypothetical protein J2847_005791 [Azospirillum agricola]|uniref:DUF3102 domain-containing protein n=1 Tax=Azospirillum agricola TaxID=1720247 RepID=UPI001AEB2455|nr:DUF3102 domain-containing protein [Azospirillum agricola]MBP2232462.1 hypothetical protein [Azospirillum agricola]